MPTRSGETRLPAEPINPYVHALGEAVQGLDTPTVEQQFTKEEQSYLKTVIFVSSPMIMDYREEGQIVHVQQCEVSRVTYNFAGVPSKAQVVL